MAAKIKARKREKEEEKKVIMLNMDVDRICFLMKIISCLFGRGITCLFTLEPACALAGPEKCSFR